MKTSCGNICQVNIDNSMSEVINIIEALGNKKMLVVKYILQEMCKTNNTLIATQDKIAKSLGVSRKVVCETLKLLEDANVIYRETGAIMLSPHFTDNADNKREQDIVTDIEIPEPDFIKVYYEAMMDFSQIHNVPVQFVLSMSKFLEWSNDGNPQYVTINKRIKEVMMTDCEVSLAQLDRYIKKSVDNGLLFRTQYRGVYEVNPFMIAKGKWESIRKLRAEYDFKNGSWQRIVK